MSATLENDRIRNAARLAQTRRQLVDLFTAARGPVSSAQPIGGNADGFPRSRTMRLLLRKQGLGAIATVLAGVLVARPAIAWRLLRLLPLKTFARTMFLRVLAAYGSKP